MFSHSSLCLNVGGGGSIDNVSDDDEEEEEGTAHNLAHVSLIAQAQHNIKHCMRYI